ncbi:MAG: methylmalonyl Co-A mutase-associated GTPase MeaB [Planctomycetota bacterium]
MTKRNFDLEPLLERFRAGQRRALARLITEVDDGRHVDEILAKVRRPDRRSLKIGITGAAGAGKSTTLAALIKHLRSIGRTVAVLACDPASPFTGGALLGDRVRMDYDPTDAGIYLRSFSTRGASGGLSDSAEAIVQLVEQFGFDVILMETVGAGQDQVSVQDLVDLLVLLVTPVAGDNIQWEKAGLMEAADVIVVNKADLPGADIAYAGLRAMLDLPGGALEHHEVPVLKTSAATGQGVEELWSALETMAKSVSKHRHRAAARRILEIAQRRLAERFRRQKDSNPAVMEIVSRFASGEASARVAADGLLKVLAEDNQRDTR